MRGPGLTAITKALIRRASQGVQIQCNNNGTGGADICPSRAAASPARGRQATTQATAAGARQWHPTTQQPGPSHPTHLTRQPGQFRNPGEAPTSPECLGSSSTPTGVGRSTSSTACQTQATATPPSGSPAAPVTEGRVRLWRPASRTTAGTPRLAFRLKHQ
ncbi:hypothetical protein NDU88_002194 [Pleurodeles waltl]|uniref:Uncharacterized protein n=1 Tax=Pleurodeles waltl TaxID=8319 RepID=A0AAV7U9T1_PLEWA|nr:hypothetical protein NDU88_002194 [Pleurodeles waltl]